MSKSNNPKATKLVDGFGNALVKGIANSWLKNWLIGLLNPVIT
jgi:hypothetical protein